jgi:hypothetical protein
MSNKPYKFIDILQNHVMVSHQITCRNQIMIDYTQYRKRYAHLAIPLTCGQAGYLAEKMETAVHRHELTEAYEENLIKVIATDAVLNGLERSVDGTLNTSPELNAEYRINAAAITIIECEKYDQMENIFNEIQLSARETDAYILAKVQKPSLRQKITDLMAASGFLASPSEKKEALHNLAGMRAIKNNIALNQH